MGYRERIAKLRAQEEEQDYIWLDREYETYSQNANRFINEVNSYGQRDGNQWRNAAALGYAQKARDLQAQGQALQEKYRRAGKQEQAAALGSQLEQFGQMRAALEQDEKYWGQWDSQAAYDQYQADRQEYERIMGIDEDATTAQMEKIATILKENPWLYFTEYSKDKGPLQLETIQKQYPEPAQYPGTTIGPAEGNIQPIEQVDPNKLPKKPAKEQLPQTAPPALINTSVAAYLQQEYNRLEQALNEKKNISYYQEYGQMDADQLKSASVALSVQLEDARQEEKEKIEEELTWLYLYRIEQGKDNNFDGQLIVSNEQELSMVQTYGLLSHEQAKGQLNIVQQKLTDAGDDTSQTQLLYKLKQGLETYVLKTMDTAPSEETEVKLWIEDLPVEELEEQQEQAEDAAEKLRHKYAIVPRDRGGGLGNPDYIETLVTEYDNGREFDPEQEQDLINYKKYTEQAQRLQEEIAFKKQYDAAQIYNKTLTAYQGKPDFESGSVYRPQELGVTDYIGEQKKLTYVLVNNPEWMKQYRDLDTISSFYPAAEAGIRAAKNNYMYLTEEERKIYNYKYNNESPDEAQHYLDSLQERLNERSGAAIQKNLEGNQFGELVYSIPAGLDQFGQGIRQAFSAEELPTSATQYASEKIRTTLGDGVMGWTYDFLNSASNMLPAIAVSAAVGAVATPAAGAAAGAALMGVSASGNAYKEALQAGYDQEQARTYSILTGISEGALQYALGGIGKLSGGALKSLTKTLTKTTLSATAKVALKYGASMVGEFTEEYLQSVLNPVFRNIALGENNKIELISWEHVYSGIMGGLTAGIFNIGMFRGVGTNSRTQQALGKAVKAGELQTELQSLELSGKVRQKVTQLTEQSSDAKTGAVVQAAAEQIDTRAEEQVRMRLEEAGADPAYARDIVNRGLGIESARLREQLRQNVAVARVAQEFAAGRHGGREIGQLRELGQRIFESSEQRSRNTAYSENEYVNYVTGLSRDGRFLTQGESAQAGQAGDGSLQPVDATGAARVMLERAFPQAGQQAQNTADGQGVAQNTAVPVVDGQPVYSDIALADYMAKQAAQQKFGDVQQTTAGLQETMYAQDMSAQLDAIPEENVVASSDIDGTIDTESREDISTSFKGIKTLEEIRIELEHAGLTQIKIDEILKMPKGKRPDPSTYLSEEYILGHLSQFNNGAAYILPKNDYDLYYRGTPKIARKDGTLFVTSKNYLNHILQQAQGNLDYVERALGYQSNSLVSGRFVIININNPQRYGVTVPSGNEVGANSEWIPGGYTSGGVPEAVVYNVINDLDSISIDIIELERDK